MRKFALAAVVGVAISFGALAPSNAANIVIGARAELAMDPHIQWLDTNTAYYMHIYSALTKIDEKSQIHPDLAESFKATGDNEWEFKLRKGVTFHDGTPVTAKDVVASFQRARTLPNATSPYTGAIASVKEVVAADDMTVKITTTRSDPALPYSIGYINIIPASMASATTDSFNTGKSVIGSGPYKFVSYKAGDQLVLEANPKYFGGKPKWDRVTFRFIPDDAARVAALLGGDVDLIDFVPPRLVERIKSAPNAEIHLGDSDRPIYLIMDTERDDSPFIRDAAGNKMTKNPLKDKRVREALTISVDRDLLSKRVMDGAASPSNQPTAPHFGYYNKDIPMPPYDVERAKKLLAEAGYPNGFGMTIHCTNDRYVNDEKVCQAMGQMYSRLGLKMEVEAQPRSVFFPIATNHKPGGRYSFLLLGYASSADGGMLPNATHSYDPDKKLGTWNLGHYSNAEVDKAIQEGLAGKDLQARYAGFSKAMKIAMEDRALIPLYVQSVIVASKKGIKYKTWGNERTVAESASLQ